MPRPISVPQARIQKVPQAIAQQVEGQDGHRDGRRRPEEREGAELHVPTGLLHHTAPGWGGRRRPKAEEAQTGLQQDRVPRGERGLHQDGGQDVGQDGPGDDAQRLGAQGSGALHVFQLPDGKRAAVHDPGEPRNVEDADH